jgi:hypothetical protein
MDEISWNQLSPDDQNAALVSLGIGTVPGARQVMAATVNPIIAESRTMAARIFVAAGTAATQTAIEQSKIQGSKIAGKVASNIKNSFTANPGSSPPEDKINSEGQSDDSNALIRSTPYPLRVDLKTDIIQRGWSDEYNLSPTSTSIPLSLTFAKLDLSGNYTQEFDDFIDGAIDSFRIQCQSEVKFKLLGDSAFTAQKVKTYFANLLEALQVYHFYASVISFNLNCQFRNDGMTSLFYMLGSGDYVKLESLKLRICNMPVPPRMEKLVNWLMSTYKDADLPGARALKFVPFTWGTSASNGFTIIANGNIIKNVNSKLDAITDTASLIARAKPSWKKYGLSSPVGYPLYSTDWLTLWANAPGVMDGNISHAYKNLNEEGLYVSHTNTLDGLIGGLFDCTIEGVDIPGLFTPVRNYCKGKDGTANKGNNKFDYYTAEVGDSKITSFYSSAINTPVELSRGQIHFLSSSGAAAEFQVPHTQRVRGMTPSTATNMAKGVFEWLTEVDTCGSNNSNFI